MWCSEKSVISNWLRIIRDGICKYSWVHSPVTTQVGICREINPLHKVEVERWGINGLGGWCPVWEQGRTQCLFQRCTFHVCSSILGQRCRLSPVSMEYLESMDIQHWQITENQRSKPTNFVPWGVASTTSLSRHKKQLSRHWFLKES